MRKINLLSLFTLVFLAFSLSGCEVVEGIFKAGMWTAFILIIIVVLIIMWIIRKIRR